MGFSRCMLIAILLFPSPSLQQTSTAPQDSQAVTILNEAVRTAGGLSAVNAVSDYTASGAITYLGIQNIRGSVTVFGLGTNEFRMDSTLPTGVRSWAIHEGQTTMRAEDGTISQMPPTSSVISSNSAFPYHTPMFPGSAIYPYGQLVTILSNPLYTISYKGIATIDGHSVHDIEVQRTLPGQVAPSTGYHIRDFFFDTSTLQLVMTQDMIPRNVVHEIRYSDYRSASGVLVPFSISERMGDQPRWQIQLDQITFNVGLQTSTFQL
jgi:hypothetical protein